MKETKKKFDEVGSREAQAILLLDIYHPHSEYLNFQGKKGNMQSRGTQFQTTSIIEMH